MIQRIRPQINATMSTTWRTWDAMKAVDLNEDTNPYICNCCAMALLHPSWWRLDLGNLYPIKLIEFIGRSDCKFNLNTEDIHYFGNEIN